MALLRDFQDTVKELHKDPSYRKALLQEALESYLEGDITAGNALLRCYLNNGQKAVKDTAHNDC